MIRTYLFRVFLLVVILGALVLPTRAYELYLDIDTDGDPTTINTITWESTATVNLVVAPTIPHEELWEFSFGMGGSCTECGGVFAYGTEHDLGNTSSWTWDTHDYFYGTWDYATCINCPDNPGFHAVFRAESIIDCCFYLDEPTVFATFDVWLVDNGPGWDGVWNYIQIDGPAVGQESKSWTMLKSEYR